MKGKNLFFLVLTIIFLVVAYFFFQKPPSIQLKMKGEGTIKFYKNLPPPFTSPELGGISWNGFKSFPFYGVQSSRGREFVKIFFSQKPDYFGIYYLEKEKIEMR